MSTPKAYRCLSCGGYVQDGKRQGCDDTCPLRIGVNLGELWAMPGAKWETVDVEVSSPSFASIAKAIGALVTEKNVAYGDAAAKTADALRILYPDGIKPEQYRDALLLVMVWDKLSRIAAGNDGAFGESAWSDIAGYGVLAVGLAKRGAS